VITRRPLLVALAFCLGARHVAAQAAPLVVESRHLGASRRVWVTLPDDYERATGRAFPLVLVLDALVVASGVRDGDLTEAGFRPWQLALRDALGTRGPSALRWTFLDLPGWSHSRTPLRAIPEGLAFVFAAEAWEVPDSLKRDVIAGRRDPLATIDAFTAEQSRRVGGPLATPQRWLDAAVLLYEGKDTARRAEAVARRRRLYPGGA
jgi:hypothetical protein